MDAKGQCRVHALGQSFGHLHRPGHPAEPIVLVDYLEKQLRAYNKPKPKLKESIYELNLTLNEVGIKPKLNLVGKQIIFQVGCCMHLVKLGERCNQIGPLVRVLERLEHFFHVGRVLLVLGIVGEFGVGQP